MPKFIAKSGEIYFEHRGARADPRVVFIHGLGCQLVQWPDSFIDGIVGAGFCAVTFDNRDAGLSHGPSPAVSAAAGRGEAVQALVAAQGAPETLSPAYTLSDMAGDVIDLLNHLGQSGAHVVGLSMGGMIGQRLAIEHAERIYSLTSIMSSTGNPGLPQPTPDALGALLGPALAEDAEAGIPANARMWAGIAGGHYDSERVGIARFAERAVRRAFRPDGMIRQLTAILADGDRRAELADVAVPTLVVHGAADPLVPPAAGRDTADAVPNARYVEVEKMGHDLPEPAVPQVVDAIVEHIRAVEVSR